MAQREAEAFGPLILRVQQELDATLVVVEHDLPLILSISDRIYCLEAGQVIAEGPPAEIRDDPRVISSYLGTDERAIQRSNAPGVALGSCDHSALVHFPPLASLTGVTFFQSPLVPRLDSYATRRNASSAAYLPLQSEATCRAADRSSRTCRPSSASSSPSGSGRPSRRSP